MGEGRVVGSKHLIGCIAAILLPATAANAAPPGQVYVVGALHALHEQEDAFGYDDLGRLIAAIKPEVILLEVTPEELAGKTETPGRPEYPKVIWPMLTAGGPKPYAMEAGQPLYGELTSDASRRFGAFEKESPVENDARTAYGKGADAALLAHWKSIADTQDATTDALARARAALNAGMVAGSGAGQARWDGVMVDASRRAIAAHPGKRILVLASYRNRFMFVEALGKLRGAKLVDMRAWLQANGFGTRLDPATAR